MKRLLLTFIVGAWQLAAVAADIKSGHIRTSDGVRLHYLEAGKGPAIVFVPGWTAPTFIWEPQLQHFSKNYRAVALDLRSQGESERVTEGHYTERLAQDVKELIEQLKLAPAVVVGHSMGVTVLLGYVSEFGTENLAGLMLVDAGIRPPPGFPEGFFARAKALSVDRRRALDQMTVDFWKKRRRSPEMARRVREASLSTPTNTALALMIGNAGRDFRPILGKIDKPIVYAITPRLKEDGELLKAGAPQARVEVFEDAGHVIYVDEPERFNSLLEELARTAFGR